jgi:hypothetical protein
VEDNELTSIEVLSIIHQVLNAPQEQSNDDDQLPPPKQRTRATAIGSPLPDLQWQPLLPDIIAEAPQQQLLRRLHGAQDMQVQLLPRAILHAPAGKLIRASVSVGTS